MRPAIKRPLQAAELKVTSDFFNSKFLPDRQGQHQPHSMRE